MQNLKGGIKMRKCKHCMGDLKQIDPSTDFRCKDCGTVFDVDDNEMGKD